MACFGGRFQGRLVPTGDNPAENALDEDRVFTFYDPGTRVHVCKKVFRSEQHVDGTGLIEGRVGQRKILRGMPVIGRRGNNGQIDRYTGHDEEVQTNLEIGGSRPDSSTDRVVDTGGGLTDTEHWDVDLVSLETEELA